MSLAHPHRYRKPNCEVAREGVEPSESRMFEIRRFASLRTAPLSVAQVGFEPTASLVLSQSGLPVAYRAIKWSTGESNPDLLLAKQTSSRWTSAPWFIRSVPRAGIEPANTRF